MRIIVMIGCLILSGCMSERVLRLSDGTEVTQTMSLTKQKQRIALLQKKLQHAEKNLQEAQNEVEELNAILHESQLSLIAKQIENYERQIRKSPARLANHRQQEERAAPFLKERELLQQMMENGPSPQAFDAQVVLDRILRMITEIKDVEEIQ